MTVDEVEGDERCTRLHAQLDGLMVLFSSSVEEAALIQIHSDSSPSYRRITSGSPRYWNLHHPERLPVVFRVWVKKTASRSRLENLHPGGQRQWRLLMEHNCLCLCSAPSRSESDCTTPSTSCVTANIR